MCLSVPTFLFTCRDSPVCGVPSITDLSWSYWPKRQQGIWCCCHECHGKGTWVRHWPFTILMVMPPVQAGRVAPNQCLERRIIADGCRNGTLHPLCFLNTKQVWSMRSFCVLGIWARLMPAVPDLLAVFLLCLAQEGRGGQWQCKQPVAYMVYWETDSGEIGRCLFEQFPVEKQTISFLQTVPGVLLCAKRPFSGTVQNLYYLGLMAVCSWGQTSRQNVQYILHWYFNSGFWFCSKLWKISGGVSFSDLQNTLVAGTFNVCRQHSP